MQKALRSALCALCLVAAMLLCGCGASVPLGERAIVKAIYLDESDGKVQAVLAVQSCKPSANAGEAQSEMQLYTGEGDSIATAMCRAEQQQNKKPFYAQNRLLFLGRGAVKAGVSQYLSYFGAEELSRTSLSVFVLPLSAQEFSEHGDSIETVVAEGERLTDESKSAGNRTFGIYEANDVQNGTFTGYLPVLRVNQAQKTLAQVTELLLFDADEPTALVEGAQLELALLFAGKGNRLTMYLTLNGVETVLRTQSIFIRREMTGTPASRVLRITLNGKLESASQDGKLLQGEALEAVTQAYNAYLSRACAQLYAKGFYRGADLFGDTWWFLQDNAQATRNMQTSGSFYVPHRILFRSSLQTA